MLKSLHISTAFLVQPRTRGARALKRLKELEEGNAYFLCSHLVSATTPEATEWLHGLQWAGYYVGRFRPSRAECKRLKKPKQENVLLDT